MRMLLSLIVAMARNRVIGRDGGLPWRLPADLGHFKRTTLGKPIVMGRATHDAIGRPLPGRHNIVVTRDTGYRTAGCTVVHSLDQALSAAGEVDEVMVIGGAELYRQALARSGRIYLTEVHAEPAGDTCFPEFDPHEWREVRREDHPADQRNDHPYSFVVLERLRPSPVHDG